MGDMQASPSKRLAQSAERAGGALNLGLLAGLDFVLCNGRGDREGGLARAKRGAVAEPAFSVKGQRSRVKGQGSRVKGQGSRVKGQGSRVKGQGSRVKGQGPGAESFVVHGVFETSLSNIALHRFERVVGFPRPVVHVFVGSSIQDSAFRVGGWGLRIQN
jgi:hypothetical protein